MRSRFRCCMRVECDEGSREAGNVNLAVLKSVKCKSGRDITATVTQPEDSKNLQ